MIRHIDAVDLATIYDDVSVVAAASALDYHYTATTAADSHCSLALVTVTLHYMLHEFYAESVTILVCRAQVCKTVLKLEQNAVSDNRFEC